MPELPRAVRSYEERLLEVIRIQTEIVRLGVDLGGVLNHVAEHVGDLTPATGSVVELHEGEEMVYRAAAGIARSQLGLRIPQAGSLSGLAVERRESLVCEDSETDPRVNREACRRVGLRSMVVVPLRHGDSAVGVLKVVSGEVGAFGHDDLRVLELVSQVIAAALWHAANHESGELFRQATRDELTGLGNRALFYDRLRTRLAQARRNHERFAVVLLDMDGLKAINDRLGHRAGDAALIELADRMKGLVRSSDTLARLGGDEFGVLLSDASDRDGLNTFLARLAERTEGPHRFERETLLLAASCGGALHPEDGTELEAILEAADQAMYAAKRARKVAPAARG